MKKLLTFFAAVLLFFSSFNLKAQVDIGLLLEGGAQDLNTYLENYMSPLFRGLGFGMNGGWYQTAKPHKTLGFDLSVSMIASQVPDANQFFTFNNSDYTNFFVEGANSAQVPTIMGPNTPADDQIPIRVRDIFDFDNDGNTQESLYGFGALPGAGWSDSEIGGLLPFNAVPVPMVQLGVGLFKGTDLKVRYIPKYIIEDQASLELLGFGLMHDITQWLPGEKLFPLSLSVFAGYTGMKTEIFLDKDAGQSMQLEATSFIGQIIASKKLFIFTPYAGIGWAGSNADVTLKGNYTDRNDRVYTDPLKLQYEDSGFRANLGLMIELAVVRFSGEYAIQEYNSVTLGFGISIR